ncbi:ABC transporter ATP-binding protein [Paenibacillus cymbidii]|uniref:ABC transporter ATP-binding protein n=1 Tax=Paenibacillus cymbidii TaxID=1639034 RepID=UPI0010813712|nr:ABC transporter ATP-binding protein [Paenibacillus cymbidii]
MSIFKAMKDYYEADRKWLLIATVCLLTNTALGLVYPNLLRYLIDDVIMPKRYGLVPYVAAANIAVVALKAGLTFLYGHFGGKFGNKVAYNLRKALYAKLQQLSFPFYDKARTGDLMSRVTSDLETIRNFGSFEVPHMFNYFACITFSSAVMFTISWQLTLCVLAVLLPLGFIAVRFQTRVEPAFRTIRTSVSQMTTAAQENITGVRTVKSYAREPHEVEKFGKRSRHYRGSNVEAAGILARYIPLMEWVTNLGVVVLAGMGGYLVLQKTLTVGELVAFMGMIWFAIGALWATGYHINVYTQTKASAERVVEILHHYVPIKDKALAAETQAMNSWEEAAVQAAPTLHVRHNAGAAHVRFDDVTFTYDGRRPVISHVTLDAPPGAVVGLLGGTGSGKSTLVHLLLRAYDVTGGSIAVDGTDIRDLPLHALRERIAIVFQETFLFSSTIRGNIAYGAEDADMERIEAAARIACAHDFIMELPQGYDTVVGERGLGLSGGQKQRIAIARALLAQPDMLILDDATSAVDMETERSIQQGLRRMRACTTFIIAHRISSLQHADEIVVLEGGEVVQRGTHAQLLAQKGLYADTYRIQSGAMAVPDAEEENRG